MRSVIVLLFFLACLPAMAQNVAVDSLLAELKKAKEDTNKVKILNVLGQMYIWDEPKKAMEFGLAALPLARELNYKKGIRLAQFVIGESLAVSGNHAKATEVKLSTLKLAEEMGDTEYIGMALISIASGYFYQGDYNQMIVYTRKAMNLPGFYEKATLRINGFFGEAFFKLGQMDSALYYTQRAYEIDQKSKRKWSVPSFTLAGIHAAEKRYELALQYFKLGMQDNQPKKDIVDGNLGIAGVYYQMGNNDSALHYAKKTIAQAKQFHFQAEALDAATIAKDIYKKSGLKDSAFAYQELVTEARDSLYNQEKIRAVQNLMFSEQLRQQDIELRTLNAQKDRKLNLEYAFIALALVTFLILFFLFSHSIMANQRLIKFLGILSLLIVFEFLNLLLHPFLDRITNHQPVLMLGAMVCIAALLIPLHHRLEKWITNIMVEKNKKIRLAAAKKTIATLEGDATS